MVKSRDYLGPALHQPQHSRLREDISVWLRVDVVAFAARCGEQRIELVIFYHQF
jgi:hypothetical protein